MDKGSALNGGPSAVTWLKGDWQTREALAAQQGFKDNP